MSDKSELWRPVPQYEGVYEVSNHGQVRRILAGKGARVGLKHPVSDGRYLKVTLSRGNRAKQVYVHHLVAHAFLGPCPLGLEINHRDGWKTNNHDDNLEYVSSGDNTRHAFRLGLIDHSGENSPFARLTWSQVDEMRRLGASGLSQAQIAQLFGLRRNSVCQILRGQRWRYRDRVRLPDVKEL